MIYTRTQSFPLVCKESFAIYFQIYFRHNHGSVSYGELNRCLAVNFAYDIFHIRGEIVVIRDLEQKLFPLRKIKIRHDGSKVSHAS
jgi:hypothetical protein